MLKQALRGTFEHQDAVTMFPFVPDDNGADIVITGGHSSQPDFSMASYIQYLSHSANTLKNLSECNFVVFLSHIVFNRSLQEFMSTYSSNRTRPYAKKQDDVVRDVTTTAEGKKLLELLDREFLKLCFRVASPVERSSLPLLLKLPTSMSSPSSLQQQDISQQQQDLDYEACSLIVDTQMLTIPRVMDICALLGDSNAAYAQLYCQQVEALLLLADKKRKGNNNGSTTRASTKVSNSLSGSLIGPQLEEVITEIRTIASQLAKESRSLYKSICAGDDDDTRDDDEDEKGYGSGTMKTNGKPKVIDLGASKFAKQRMKEKAEKRIAELQSRAQKFAISQQQQSSSSLSIKNHSGTAAAAGGSGGKSPLLLSDESVGTMKDLTLFVVDIAYSLASSLSALNTNCSSCSSSSSSIGAATCTTAGDNGKNKQGNSGGSGGCMLADSVLLTRTTATVVVSSSSSFSSSGGTSRPVLSDTGYSLIVSLQRLYEEAIPLLDVTAATATSVMGNDSDHSNGGKMLSSQETGRYCEKLLFTAKKCILKAFHALLSAAAAPAPSTTSSSKNNTQENQQGQKQSVVCNSTSSRSISSASAGLSWSELAQQLQHDCYSEQTVSCSLSGDASRSAGPSGNTSSTNGSGDIVEGSGALISDIARVYRNTMLELVGEDVPNAAYVLDAICEQRRGLLKSSLLLVAAQEGRILKGARPPSVSARASAAGASSSSSSSSTSTAATAMGERGGGRRSLSETERQDAISGLKSIFPSYGEGFLDACLLAFDNSPERTVDALLSENLPPGLLKMDRSLKAIWQGKGGGAAKVVGKVGKAGVEKYELKESSDQKKFLAAQKERVKEMERQAEIDFALRNAEYDDDYDDQYDDVSAPTFTGRSDVAGDVGLFSSSSSSSQSKYTPSSATTSSSNKAGGGTPVSQPDLTKGGGEGEKEEEDNTTSSSIKKRGTNTTTAAGKKKKAGADSAPAIDWGVQMANMKRLNNMLRQEEEEGHFWESMRNTNKDKGVAITRQRAWGEDDDEGGDGEEGEAATGGGGQGRGPHPSQSGAGRGRGASDRSSGGGRGGGNGGRGNSDGSNANNASGTGGRGRGGGGGGGRDGGGQEQGGGGAGGGGRGKGGGRGRGRGGANDSSSGGAGDGGGGGRGGGAGGDQKKFRPKTFDKHHQKDRALRKFGGMGPPV